MENFLQQAGQVVGQLSEQQVNAVTDSRSVCMSSFVGAICIPLGKSEFLFKSVPIYSEFVFELPEYPENTLKVSRIMAYIENNLEQVQEIVDNFNEQHPQDDNEYCRAVVAKARELYVDFVQSFNQ